MRIQQGLDADPDIDPVPSVEGFQGIDLALVTLRVQIEEPGLFHSGVSAAKAFFFRLFSALRLP